MDNTLGMRGLAFIAFSGPRPEALHATLQSLGFSRTHRRRDAAVDAYAQGEMTVLLDRQEGGHASRFAAQHGPGVPALGLAFEDPRAAFAEAVRRGARRVEGDRGATVTAPAIEGVGGSSLYFVDAKASFRRELVALDRPALVPSVGFSAFDHLTNNVENGTLGRWGDFYKRVLGFSEVRSFDIEGKSTGLYSYALRSPCGTFCIPINEDKDDKGQIAEYLREYRGPGVQHVAFLARDILASLDALRGQVPTLDIDDDYYAEVFGRVPGVREDRARIRAHQVLVDGDDQGYLLQIFTKNLVGPVFFEFIQRENHLSFGEGNFGALFRSIERDQERRGMLG